MKNTQHHLVVKKRSNPNMLRIGVYLRISLCARRHFSIAFVFATTVSAEVFKGRIWIAWVSMRSLVQLFNMAPSNEVCSPSVSIVRAHASGLKWHHESRDPWRSHWTHWWYIKQLQQERQSGERESAGGNTHTKHASGVEEKKTRGKRLN